MNIHFYLTVIVICNFTMGGTGLSVQFSVHVKTTFLAVPKSLARVLFFRNSFIIFAETNYSFLYCYE